MKKLFATFIALIMMTGCTSASTVTVDDTAVTTSIVSIETTTVTTEPIVEETSLTTTQTSVETTSTTTETEFTEVTTSVATVESTIATTTVPIEVITSTKTTSITTIPTTLSQSKPAEITSIVSKKSSKKNSSNLTESNTSTSVKIKDVVEISTRVILPVENIQQMPELPAGCEVTATTIVMNYEGIKVDKMTLMTYLPMMQYPDENGLWESPWNKFVGNPKLTYYGCYSPVIIETVESCLETNEIDNYEVVDLSNSSIEELYAQIDDGHPVIVWATMFMKASYTGRSAWKIQDGSTFNWRSNEHCLVLIGYDTDKNTVILSDPYDSRGTVEYDADLFESRYDELYNQALIIRRTDK